MSAQDSVYIDAEAAKALALWKAAFADDVSEHARRLAAASGSAERVSLRHYREAAQISLTSLLTAIQKEIDGDANRKAA